MDETPPINPGVPQETYRMLGKKTLWIFVFQRTNAAFIILLLSIFLFVLGQQSSLRTTQFGDLTHYATVGGELCLLLFVVLFGLVFLFSWLEYVNFKFALAENSLKIKKGIVSREEIAIPYRQIQDVDIKRNFSFMLMGLSQIVILTAGREDDSNKDESEGVLPALDKDLAEWLQQELLQRANVQKVTEMPAPSNPPTSGTPAA